MASNASPWAKTPISAGFLQYYVHRQVPPQPSDTVMLLPTQFASRPDLLSNQLYGTPDLWWVIPQRNGLEDPIYGLVPGMLLFVPSPSFVQSIIK